MLAPRSDAGWREALVIITGLVGLVAGIAAWRGHAPSAAPRWLPVVGAAAAVAVIIVGVVASVTFDDATLVKGDVVVSAKDSTFTPTALTVDHGQVSFFLDNTDNTLHNFHLKGAGGDPKTMPAGHKVRYTVTLQAGTYEYVCDLHDGMTGTLTVK